ncbi:flagellar basal body L-ring protein FlgH [Halodesulfovibrio marinisediminis]|uniref:Flagellar L-ring protein n=1 Tax=Halodesulfovibrio marinisediminis DSM 17456 TaxID=1121457 RepID=A0A1N6J4X4_9BACT|nr:flagellar basal body L-ring protein FlgH [Halodesulfovibrio marinisediminis]SIO39292.1 flagellar L-ring protein precursor FlgH [Halodesulfovibrio marinisediminis DSM 17456]
MNVRFYSVIILAALMLTGCQAAKEKPVPSMPVAEPPQLLTPEMARANPGSLFQPTNADFLFADNRARRVGDIVMVNIVENASAKNKADTTSDKDSSIDLGVDAFLGKSSLPLLGKLSNPMVKASGKNKFKGEGETNRENKFTATVACRVLRVSPGGLLQIEGVRETQVNNETQYLMLTGLIRARDIADNNSILSSQVANARIKYFGEGVIADKQKPGWITRLMDTVWPF